MNIEISGIHDIRIDYMGKNCQTKDTKNVRGFEDAPGMLDSIRPDLYVVATTAPAHFELVNVALSLQIPFILVEKPPFCSLQEMDSVVANCSANSCIFFNFNRRYVPVSTLLSEKVRDRSFGELVSTNVIGGNIGLAMGGSHWIEFHSWLTGASPTAVRFESNEFCVPNPRGPEFIDASGRAIVEFDNRTHLAFHIDGRSGHGLVATYTFERGIVISNELSGHVQVLSRRDNRPLPTTRYGEEELLETFSFGLPDIEIATSRVLQQGLANLEAPGLESARMVTETLVAAFISAEEGGTKVQITASLDRSRHFNWA